MRSATISSAVLSPGTDVTARRRAAAWPDAVALREALQHPKTALTDDLDLCRAAVACGRDELPLIYTGRFAAVFRLTLPGEVPVALRVFTSAGGDADRAVRAELASAALERVRPQVGDLLPPFVSLPQAIRIAGNVYPAQILPWAPGQPLLTFIAKQYRNAAALRTLAETIADAVARLEAAGLSHGDLQHDNILVAEGGRRVTFVDYDGLYAPELADLPPSERGHANYQHPARFAGHYGPGIDRFAVSAIRTGLLLIAEEPLLWERYGDHREAVLFAADDFADPDGSPLFGALREFLPGSIREESLQALREFEALCRAPLPPLLPLPKRLALQAIPSESGAARWPSRVSPTCPEERIAPVSYLQRLRRPSAITGQKSNFALMRAYAMLIPPLLSIAWIAANRAGGAKWPCIAYIFALCATLGFAMLYLSWPVKRQWDALESELGWHTERARRDGLLRKSLSAEIADLEENPPTQANPREERAYLVQALSRIPVGRAIDAAGVSAVSIRLLRRNGIDTAAQLWRRHGLLPLGIDPSDTSRLVEWARSGAAFHRERYALESSPLRRLRHERQKLDDVSAARSERITALQLERGKFPDATLRAYLTHVFLPALAACSQ